jgi:hypothetical protein
MRTPVAIARAEMVLNIHNWEKEEWLFSEGLVPGRTQSFYEYKGPLDCIVWIDREDNGALTLIAIVQTPSEEDDGQETLELTEATLVDIPELLGKAIAYKGTLLGEP